MSEFGFKVTSDSTQAQKDLNNLNKSVNNIAVTTEKASNTLASLAKSVGAVFAGLTAFTALNKANDSLINLENSIGLVTGRTKDLIAVQKELIAISVRARGTTASAAEVFTKFGRSLSGTGISNRKLLNATEVVQKAIAVSGTTAASAEAAIFQLGQGLASGQLRGEELNSVLEQTPRLAQAIAEGLGYSVGELRALAEAGKLTSEKVFKALLSQTEKINSEFNTLAPTFESATTQLNESIKRVLGEFSRATGGSERLTKFILKIADSLNKFADDIGIIVFEARLELDDLFDYFKDTFDGIYLIYSKFKSNLTNITFSGVFDSTLEAFKTLRNGVASLTFKIPQLDLASYIPSLDSVIKTIGDFGKFVKHVFYSIWDEVVGHSTWPDFIEGVVAWAKTLLPSVSALFEPFKRYVLNLFKAVGGVLSDLKLNIELTYDESKQNGIVKKIIDAFSSISQGNLLGSINLGQISQSLDLSKFINDIKQLLDSVSGFFGRFGQIASNSLNTVTVENLKNFGRSVGGAIVIGLIAVFNTRVRALLAAGLAIKLAIKGQDALGGEGLKTAARELGISLGKVIKDILFTDSEKGVTDLLKTIGNLIAEFGKGILEGAGFAGASSGRGLIAGLLFGTGATAVLTGNIGKVSKLIYENIIKPLITGKEISKEILNADGSKTITKGNEPSFIEKAIFGPEGASSGSKTILDATKNLNSNIIKGFVGVGSTALGLIFSEWAANKINKTFGIEDTFTQIGVMVGTSIFAGVVLNNLSGKLITYLEGILLSGGILRSAGTAGLLIAGGILGGILGQKAADFLGLTDPFERFFLTLGAASATAFVSGWIGVKIGALILNALKKELIAAGLALAVALGSGFSTAGIMGAIKGLLAFLVSLISAPAVLVALGLTAAGSLIYYIFWGADEDSVGGKIRNWFKSTWTDIASGWDALVARIKNTKNPFTLSSNDPLLFPNGAPTQKKANGGHIRGAGTGTSDSILAKLSNGEFVINANSTKKYRGLLEAINQNSLPGYVSGGYVDELRKSEGYVPRVYSDSLRKLTVGIGHRLNPSEISQFKLGKYEGESDSVLEKLNFIPYTKDQIETLFKVDLANAVNSAAKVVAGYGQDYFKLPLKIQDVLTDMAYQLGESGLSKFKSFVPAVLEKKYEFAAENLKNSLNFQQTPGRVSKRIEWLKQALTDLRSEGRSTMDTMSDPRRLDQGSFFDRFIESIRTRFSEVNGFVSGAGGSDNITAMLSPGEYVVNSNDARDSFNKKILEAMNSGTDIKRLFGFQSGTSTISGGINIDERYASLESKLANRGFDTNNIDMNNLQGSEIRRLNSLLKDLNKIEAKILKEQERLGDENALSADLIQQIGRYTDGLALLDKTLAGAYKLDNAQGTPGLSSGAKKFGSEQAASFQGEFTSGFASYLKGKNSFKEFKTGILDSFTGKIVDGFAQGLVGSAVDTLGLDKMFSNLFGGAFGFGESTGGFLTGGKVGETIANAAWVRIAPGVESVSKMLGSSGIGGIGDVFKSLSGSVFSSIGSLFSGTMFGAQAGVLQQALGPLQWFADGGVVAGAGATPIIAHAGEVILNEAQQARVAAAMSNSNQQVVNLNITGDISRQTKSEIYKMLPSIAEGVNSHNREKGLR